MLMRGAPQLRRAIHQWILSTAILLAPQAEATGLGEIRVDSHLGAPLRAQIALVETTDADARNLKVRLASAEDYKKSGLRYPQGIKFEFEIVNGQGASPFIRVSTARHVEEPFLNLLVEVSSLSGKIAKAYTLLIDLTPSLTIPYVLAEQAGNTRQVEEAGSGPEETGRMVEASKPAEVKPPAIGRPIERKAKARQRIAPAAGSERVVPTLNDAPLRAASETNGATGGEQTTKRFGQLALSLSMSLSISRNDPSQASSADALQEELIAKEKTVAELNAQIAEMQGVIRVLQGKLGIRGSSAAAEAAVPAASGIAESAVAEARSITPKMTASATVRPPEEAKKPSGLSDRYWPQALVALVLLVSAAGGYFWYHRRKAAQGWKPGNVDEPGNLREQPGSTGSVLHVPGMEAEGMSIVRPPEVLDMTLPFGEQSIKVPAVNAQKTESILPPEYEMLEEADIYLRFGHDRLAEEVLREAININPKNPQAYLTLLRIYASREDPVAFLSVVQHLQSLGDESAWKKAVEMGRNLDPHNDFYH